MLVNANADHRAFYKDVVALLDKHAGKLEAREMLAIAAQLVGKLIAVQDQRGMTADMALDIVGANIEEGNRQALEGVKATRGGA